jgi:predicted oxidoreductase (fatty acid repression mutant protein)
MAINVKGGISVSNRVVKASAPVVDIKKYIANKLNKVEEPPKTVVKEEPEQIIKKVSRKIIYHRETPVKQYELVDEQKYHTVEDGELIKHYNKKSLYLADMISLDTDSN